MTQIGLTTVGADRRRGWSVGGVGVVEIAVGVFLSVAVFVLVHVDLYASDPHGSALDALAATAMTLPVVWARRYPLQAAAVAASGAMVSWLLVGSYVRCGAAFPAAFWLACAIGLRLRGRRALVAMLLVLVDLQAVCLADAAVIPATIIPLAPTALAFWFAGRTIRSRGETIARLAHQNEQLVLATRERTAQLAVDNDRRRISEGLNQQLQRHIEQMAATAAAGRGQVADAQSAQAAFAAIADDGRQTLAHMREVVDALRADAARPPAPDRSRLADLVARHGGVLSIDGDQRRLPEGVELSGYRVVEQLLRAVDADAGLVVDVHAHFGTDELEPARCRSGAPGRAVRP